MFHAQYNPALVRDLNAVLSNVRTGKELLIDTRSVERFVGTGSYCQFGFTGMQRKFGVVLTCVATTAPEPRPGLRSGHAPGSRNVPSGLLVNADGTMKSAAEIEAVLLEKGIDFTRYGSDVTAA